MTPINQRFLKKNHKKSLEPTEISICLDSYNNMFSDFDPRPYLNRSFSEDFILQVRKVAKDKTGSLSVLNLLLSDDVRNKTDEKNISKHLHSFFKNSHEQLLEKKRKIIFKGIILATAGSILMIIASYISFMKPEKYFIHMLLVLFDPAGWFLLWIGLDHLVYYSKNKIKELNFYAKMVKVKIKFSTY